MTSQPECQDIAKRVAEKSIVLLKNEGVLPIAKSVKKIAVIGQNAVLKTQSGGMGAGVKALYEVTPLEGIRKRAGADVQVTYAPGYKNFPGRRWGPAPVSPWRRMPIWSSSSAAPTRASRRRAPTARISSCPPVRKPSSAPFGKPTRTS